MKSKNLFVITALLFLFLLTGASCSKSSDSSTAPVNPDTADISIVGMSYSPSSKTVTKGSVVKWTNTDGTAHTVTSNDGTSFDSGTINASGTYSYTANTVGTFAYHCTIHGVAMAGTLIVNP